MYGRYFARTATVSALSLSALGLAAETGDVFVKLEHVTSLTQVTPLHFGAVLIDGTGGSVTVGFDGKPVPASVTLLPKSLDHKPSCASFKLTGKAGMDYSIFIHSPEVPLERQFHHDGKASGVKANITHIKLDGEEIKVPDGAASFSTSHRPKQLKTDAADQIFLAGKLTIPPNSRNGIYKGTVQLDLMQD
jgi:hypothetical protein